MRELLLLFALAQAAPAGLAPAEALSTPRPIYPREAARSGIEGTVVVQFTIDPAGHVSDASVVEPVPGFDAPAIEAVKQWHFKPAQRGGTPVSTKGRVPVEFRLTPEASGAPLPLPSPPADLDVRKTLAYGEGHGDMAAVRRDGDICSTVELSSPALRLARFARMAREENVRPRPTDVERQAAGLLTVYFARQIHVVSGFRTSVLGKDVPNSGAQTCPVSVPSRIVLRSERGEELAARHAPSVISRRTVVRDLRAPGSDRSYPVLDAVAFFDWDTALRLADGRELRVVVGFDEGKPATVVFTAEDLARLTPIWSKPDPTAQGR
jgi:TonB family protein